MNKWKYVYSKRPRRRRPERFSLKLSFFWWRFGYNYLWFLLILSIETTFCLNRSRFTEKSLQTSIRINLEFNSVRMGFIFKSCKNFLENLIRKGDFFFGNSNQFTLVLWPRKIVWERELMSELLNVICLQHLNI